MGITQLFWGPNWQTHTGYIWMMPRYALGFIMQSSLSYELHRWLQSVLLLYCNKNLINCFMSFQKVKSMWSNTTTILSVHAESTTPLSTTTLPINVCCPIVGQTYLTDQVSLLKTYNHNFNDFPGYIPICKNGCIGSFQGTPLFITYTSSIKILFYKETWKAHSTI